jgi:hypothetical protein
MRGLHMIANCSECGHEWQLGKPLGEYEDGPRCGECGSRDPEIIESPLGFDPDEAVGGGTDDSQTEQLREALRATPGIGDSAVDYCTYWFKQSVDGPEDLHDLLLELGSVDQQVSRRIVTSIYGEGDGDDAPAPFAVGAPDDGDTDADTGDDTDTLDAIIKAKQAGLIDADDGGGVDSAEVAEAVTSAMEPALQQIASAVAATQDGDGRDEIQALREEVEQLREEREKSEYKRLEQKIEEIEAGTDPGSEIMRLRETRDMLENAPSVSAEAADEWGDVAHSLLDRLTAMQRQRELLGAPDVDDRQPEYAPAPTERGQRPPAQAPRQRPAPAQATADGGTAPGGGSQAPTGGDGDDRDPSDGEPTDSETAERVREVRENLGIAEEGSES